MHAKDFQQRHRQDSQAAWELSINCLVVAVHLLAGGADSGPAHCDRVVRHCLLKSMQGLL